MEQQLDKELVDSSIDEELKQDGDGNYILNEEIDLSQSEDADMDKLVNDLGTEENADDDSVRVEFEKTPYAYDTDCPMPGNETDMLGSYNDNLDMKSLKDAGAKSLIANMAINKMKKERQAYLKESDDVKLHDYIVAETIRNQQNQYFAKYGFEMTGRQKRVLRKSVERSYQKHKKDMSPKQRQDILDYLNMPSQNESSEKEKEYKDGSVASMAKQVEDLMKMKL